MTTTLIFGDTSDGFLQSNAPTATQAWAGPPGSVNTTGVAGWYGQNNNAGYTALQTFIRFVLPALDPSVHMITGCAIRLHQISHLSTGVTRNLEIRSFDWSGGGLTAADWRNLTQLGAAPLRGQVNGVQASGSRVVLAGGDSLRDEVASSTAVNFVLVSSRQRAGNTPASDEGSSVALAEQIGTTFDPCLVYTSVLRHGLVPVLGAEVQLPDGSWAYLTSGGGVVQLHHRDSAGAVTTLGSLPIGASATSWADAKGAQGFSLAVDDQGNIYAAGVAGDAVNSLRIQSWTKTGPGWTAGTPRTVALPAYGASVNNVAMAWHPTANGTLVVFAAHAVGQGISGSTGNDVAYVLLDSGAIRSGGTWLRATDSALSAGVLLPGTSGFFNTFANETGTGLDVAADRHQRDQGYVLSHQKGDALGADVAVAMGRYILAPTGASFSHASTTEEDIWTKKDAGGKLRVLSVGPGQVVAVSADWWPGFGLSVTAYQVSGALPGGVMLGQVVLADEDIPTMPDGPDVAAESFWDAAYSATEHAVWIYYRDATNPNRVMRTSVDLTTYQATRREVQVLANAGGAVRSIRVPRGAAVTDWNHVTVAYQSGATEAVRYLVDTFNVAPTSPPLSPRANYDATTAAIFAWTFTDPNTGDTQSAYQFQVEDQSGGAVVFDSGKVVSSTSAHSLAAGTLVNGRSYRWRVRTYDAAGLVSPWSTYGTFSTAAGGTVTITDPAVDNPPDVITDDYLIQWAVAGTTQAAYRFRRTRMDSGITVEDSGWVASTATSRLVTHMQSDITYRLDVTVRNAALVESGTGSRLITPSYGSPEVPVVSVAPRPEEGHVLIQVENPIPQGDRPEVTRNRILRRRAGTQDPWEVVGECGLSGTFRDYTAPGRIPVEYMVRGEAE